MPVYHDGFHTVQYLYNQLVWQTKKLNDLDQTIRRMQEELSVLKQQKPIHVERIEYKFDQLKVERLEGTLSIGMMPNGNEAIEEWSVNGQSAGDPPVPMERERLIRQISDRIYQYLNREGHDVIRRMEDRYHFPLNEETRQRMIADLARQVEGRARTYVNHMQMDVSGDQLPDSEEMVFEKVKQDIGTAIENYFKRVTSSGA